MATLKNSEKRTYKTLRAGGKCVKCTQPALPDRSMCDVCNLRGVWATNRSNSISRGYAPINVDVEAFVAWYLEKRASCNGLCEWCDEPFGVRGPVADHDHATGDLRALICQRCNFVEGMGLVRLKKVVHAIEQWDTVRRTKPHAKLLFYDQQPNNPSIRWSFPRWAKRVMRTKNLRDKRLSEVIAEMRERCASSEIFDSTYAAFRLFLEEQEKV